MFCDIYRGVNTRPMKKILKNTEIETHKYTHMIFETGTKAFQWKEERLSTVVLDQSHSWANNDLPEPHNLYEN